MQQDLCSVVGFNSPRFLIIIHCLVVDLVYYMSQGEIGRRSGGDNVLEREGHAVSAGFALGLVALGTSGLVFALVKFL